MKINLTQNTVLQGVAIVIQIANALSPSLSEKHQAAVASGVAVVQLLISRWAHQSNPDGTPAEVAYVDPKKQ
jgi:hypothetical protein